MRQGQDARERLVLDNLLATFPGFAGTPLSWKKPPKGDPPDFISDTADPLGLELGEWLNEDQMSAAKGWELRSTEVCSLLRADWESEYRPKNFRDASLTLGAAKMTSRDKVRFRKEFYDYAAEVDSSWLANPGRFGNTYEPMGFPSTYPLLQKYVGIRFIGGRPHGVCWIDMCGDGGSYDPMDAVTALTKLLDKKLENYWRPSQQDQLKGYRLKQFSLLVHHGSNAFAYNTPSRPFWLSDIASRAAQYYAQHPKRHVFDRVWVFDALDNATEIDQLVGFQPEAARSRWLAELWPSFQIDPRSI